MRASHATRIGCSLALSVAVAALLPGCATSPQPASGDARCTQAGGTRELQADLLFGRDVAGRGPITDAQRARFVADAVTPRFPDGLTTWDTRGQWRDRETGRIVREESFVSSRPIRPRRSTASPPSAARTPSGSISNRSDSCWRAFARRSERIVLNGSRGRHRHDHAAGFARTTRQTHDAARRTQPPRKRAARWPTTGLRRRRGLDRGNVDAAATARMTARDAFATFITFQAFEADRPTPGHHTGASSLPARARFGDARGPTPRILGDGASRGGRSPSPPPRAAPAARSPASTPPGAQRRRAQAAPTPPAKPRRPKKTGAAGARFLVMRSASPIADQGLLPSNMSMICRFSSGVTGGGVRPAAPAEPSASFALTVGLAAGLKSTLATKPAPGVRSA